jgi:hypothetical protein
MKAIAIIASVILMVRPLANAQTDTTKKSIVDFTTGVDIYSRYLWRGFQNGNAPAFQPTFKMTIKNFQLGAWGSVQASDLGGVSSVPETDLFATYTLPKGFSITFNDYFVSPNEFSVGNYSDYSKNSYHQIEGYLTWAGPEKFPLTINVGYSFYGASFDTTAAAIGNMKGSIFTELDYAIKNLTIVVAGGNKYYTQKEDYNLVNVGFKIVKNVVITDKFTLPITGQLMYNPNTKQMHYAVGFSF